MTEAEAPRTRDAAAVIRMLRWAAVVGFTLQSLKTIGFPSLWAATQLNFDYAFGFVRRGLLGAALRATGLDMGDYGNVVSVGYAALVAAFAALAWFGRRARLHETVSGAFLGVVFWSSWAVAYSVHTVGYLDHALLLVALASIGLCLRLPELPAAVLASGLGTLGIGVHENYAVVCAPLVFVCLLLQRRWVGCALFAAAISGASWFVLELGPPGGVSPDELVEHYDSITEYRIRPDAVDVLFRDTAANLAEMRRRWSEATQRLSLALSLLVFLSAGLPLVVAAHSVARRSAANALHRALLSFAVPAAAAAPLGLHLVGWDMHRWNALVVMNAFVLLCLAQVRSGQPLEFSSETRDRWLRSGVFAVFLGLATGFGLFSRMDVVNAPYLSHVEYVLDLLAGRAEFPRVPLH